MLALWLRQKVDHGIIQLRYLSGDGRPAIKFLDAFRRTGSFVPVPGKLGQVRGYSSQTVVADLDLSQPRRKGAAFGDGKLVVKFEICPGQISMERCASELRNEKFAREYLDPFMPPTLRVIGHGIDRKSSALVYQKRVPGKRLRDVRWQEIRKKHRLRANVIEFCDRVWLMGRETGRLPDIAGTLPRVDHLTNCFWQSRNVVVDAESGGVWLVDTGWKEGQELLREGPVRPRLRTWFRLYTMRFFRWWIARADY